MGGELLPNLGNARQVRYKCSVTDRSLTVGDKALIVLAVVVAYGSNWWPGRAVLGAGQIALGHPPYEGFVGLFLPHLLLYSTLMAMISALFWWALVRAGLLPGPQFGNVGRAAGQGIIVGLAALAFTLVVVSIAFPSGTIHWIPPDPWKIAGNVFSNFYEEFVFRGFVLVSLRRLVDSGLGRWFHRQCGHSPTFSFPSCFSSRYSWWDLHFVGLCDARVRSGRPILRTRYWTFWATA